MRFLDDCNDVQASRAETVGAEATQDEGPYGRWARAFARLLHMVAIEAHAPVQVRVFYKFDSGRWRHRSTRQLHKVYRCK